MKIFQHISGGGDTEYSGEGDSRGVSPGQMLGAAAGKKSKGKTESRAGSPGGSSHEGSIRGTDPSHTQVGLKY